MDDTNTIQTTVKNKNVAIYIPEPTDSIIETNTGENQKILINGDEILNLDKGTIADGVMITLSTDKTEGFSKRDIVLGEQRVGQLIIVRNADEHILEDMETNTSILNPDYDKKKVFAESSTNGLMGIGLEQTNSEFTKESYKSIEDTSDSTLGL